MIKKRGTQSTILLTSIDFSNDEYFHQKVLNEFEIFKLPLVENKIIESIKYIFERMNNKETNIEEEIKEQRKKYETEIDELKKIILKQKQEFDKKLENQYEEIIKILTNENLKIISELGKQLKQVQETNETEIATLKRTIFNINDSQYFEQRNLETFNELKGETQSLIYQGIQDKQRKEQANEITELFSFLSKEQKKSNFKYNEHNYITIQTKFKEDDNIDDNNNMNNITKENIDNIKMMQNTNQMLNENETLQTYEFINLMKKINNIYFQLEYPSTDYQEIYETVSKIKKEEYPEMNIIVNISKLEEGNKTFQHNTNIKMITIETTSEIIPGGYQKGLFEGCSSLENVIIPSTIKYIGGSTFNSCTNLREIIIPSSVEVIENSTFKGCSKLTTIIISSDITTIDNSTFKGCSKLTQVNIPTLVTSIQNSAFEKCTSLTQIDLPSSISSIRNSSFKDCSLLSQIILPSSITFIGNNTFENCSSLSQIEFPSSISSIGESSFEGCKSLITIING